MNKKGTHVDWAISMGIFLVYIIGMFILLRPGVTPVHKPEGLLELLENKFMENVTYEVREIPLIVKRCLGDFESGDVIYTEISVEDENEFFEFSKWKDSSGMPVLGKEIVCGMDGDEEHPPIKEIAPETFYLTYYQIDPEENSAKLVVDCSPFDDEDHCIANLGASTSKIGINTDWLNKLGTISYEELKENWDFPKDKNFAIYVGKTEEELSKESSKLTGAIEPQGINLFIKQFKTQSVEQDGDITIPIIVNLRIW